MKEWFNEHIFDKNGNVSSRKISNIRNKYPDIYQKILDNITFLSNDVKLIIKIYYCYYNIKEVIKCKICDNPVNFINFNKGFHTYCSVKCAYKNKETIQKRQSTNLKKYGEKNVGSYGSNTFKEKMFEKYGDENYNNRKKASDTCLKNYGVKWPQQSDQVKEKTKQNNFIKYGVEFASQYEPFIEKQKQTCLERYGVEYITQCENIKKSQTEGIKKSNLLRYGVEWSVQRHLLNIENMNRDFIENRFVDKNGYIQTPEIQEYFNISKSHTHTLVRRLGIKGKYNRESYGETEIYDFLLNYLEENQIVKNNRKLISPYEVDFYIDEYNLAIEFNGLYWHTEDKGKDENYHLNKTVLCQNKEVQLLHIYEHEWNQKTDVWKSIILDYLEKNDTIYAKECNVIELLDIEYRNFIENNSFNEYVYCDVKLGLLYDDKLVSCMGFNKLDDGWISLGNCNKIFNNINGGVDKIIKYFVEKYSDNITVYIDKRIGCGQSLINIGFENVGCTSPDYFYFKGNGIMLKNEWYLLNDYKKELTKHQNMCINGYSKVFDCGYNILKKEGNCNEMWYQNR